MRYMNFDATMLLSSFEETVPLSAMFMNLLDNRNLCKESRSFVIAAGIVVRVAKALILFGQVCCYYFWHHHMVAIAMENPFSPPPLLPCASIRSTRL